MTTCTQSESLNKHTEVLPPCSTICIRFDISKKQTSIMLRQYNFWYLFAIAASSIFSDGNNTLGKLSSLHANCPNISLCQLQVERKPKFSRHGQSLCLKGTSVSEAQVD